MGAVAFVVVADVDAAVEDDDSVEDVGFEGGMLVVGCSVGDWLGEVGEVIDSSGSWSESIEMGCEAGLVLLLLLLGSLVLAG